MCNKPITAFINPDGGRPIFGYEGVRLGLQKIELPCGKCTVCCKDYYTSWATRGSRELSRWDFSIFLTATYSEENLPAKSSLRKKDVQNFIKRVKKRFKSSTENPIRQIYCGEYGTKATRRPHYHVVLFNCNPGDFKPHRITDQGHQVFTSKLLTELWGNGHVEVSWATPATIAYLFKYILKKKTRKERKIPLIRVDENGEAHEVEHEFIEASRNPGIGAHMRGSMSIKKGYLTVNGVKKKLPKYYLEDLRKNDPESYDRIQNLKFDFMLSQPQETQLRKEQKENAQKILTDTKKRL